MLEFALSAAKAATVDLIEIDIKEGEDFRPYFAKAIAAGAQAIYYAPLQYFSGTLNDGKMLAELLAANKIPLTATGQFLPNSSGATPNSTLLGYLAVLNKVPTIGSSGEAGTMLSYGSNTFANWRRAGQYVATILKGASPADLPVESPSVFDCIVNLKTAKAIGIAIPQSVLFQATQVIE